MMRKLLILLALPTLLYGQSTQSFKWVKTDTVKSRSSNGKILVDSAIYVIYSDGTRHNLDSVGAGGAAGSGVLDSVKAGFGIDTVLTGDSVVTVSVDTSVIPTDYDLSLKLPSSDTSTIRAYSNSLYLKNADSTTQRTYSNSLYLKNADSTTQRTYSNSLYLKNADSTTQRNYSTSLYLPKITPTATGLMTVDSLTTSVGGPKLGTNATNTISFPTAGTDGATIAGTGSIYEVSGSMVQSSAANYYMGIDNDNNNGIGNSAFRFVTNGGTLIADSTLFTISDRFRIGVGRGNTAPLSPLSVYTPGDPGDTLGINLTNRTLNTVVNTVAESRDTSTFSWRFTATGKPIFDINGITGNSKLTMDSTGLLELPGISTFSNIILGNNSYYGVKTSGGVNKRILGISSGNDVYVGAIDDVGGNVYIREDGANKITISGGNVGVGITPTAKFSILNAGTSGDTVGLNITNSAYNKTTSTPAQASDTSAFSFRFSNTGKPVINVNGITGNSKFAMDTAGSIRIGTPFSGSSPLNVQSDDDVPTITLRINASQANITTSDQFIKFFSTDGLEASIAGTASAGVIAYNTFTGAHYAQKKLPNEPMITGMIVSATGDLLAGKGQLPLITKSTGRNDKAVFGVYSGKVSDGVSQSLADSLRQARDFRQLADSLFSTNLHEDSVNANVYLFSAKRIRDGIGDLSGRSGDYALGDPRRDIEQVFALGVGYVLVTNSGGDISVGDLIASSPTRGLGEKQADDIVHSYTVAKSNESVDFTSVPVHPQLGVKVKRIAVSYK